MSFTVITKRSCCNVGMLREDFPKPYPGLTVRCDECGADWRWVWLVGWQLQPDPIPPVLPIRPMNVAERRCAATDGSKGPQCDRPCGHQGPHQAMDRDEIPHEWVTPPPPDGPVAPSTPRPGWEER